MEEKHVLFIVTSAGTMAPLDRETGVWLSEFAEPYLTLAGAGLKVTVASPAGGKAPIDGRSINGASLEFLSTTPHLERTLKLADIRDTSPYDAVFLPGGHGTMFDLPDNADLGRIIREMYEAGKIIAAVCHGPAGLVGVTLSDGSPLVRGKRLTAFTDDEEKAVELDQHMPFLLESKLRELGADFARAENWEDHVEFDGRLITGQNPQSALSVAGGVLLAIG